jgi:hypothetical protein
MEATPASLIDFNEGGKLSIWKAIFPVAVPSFPRKRESIFALAPEQMDSRFRGNDGMMASA